MVRMENDAKNDTNPVLPPSKKPSEKPDISETQPTPLPEQAVPLDQTQPHLPESAPDSPPVRPPVGPQDMTQAVHIQPDHLDETRPMSASQLISPQPERSPTADAVQPAAAPNGQGGLGTPENSTSARPKRSWRWLLYAALGLLLLTSIGFASGYGGYLSAIDLRVGWKATQVSGEAQHQFDLGMQDMQAGRFDLARQRFEYVISLNPNFPGITEVLAQVLLEINTTATPTIAPTPTLSPTPDLRSQEDLYLQARQDMAGAEWSTAIDTLLTLRKRVPEYMTVEIAGLLYVALRNRGVQKISLQADLEGGSYDLTLAKGFGPLDVEARNWRDWAEFYIRGASFWDVDWQQAVYYFSQLAQIAPNLMDASRLTAVERYTLALIGYGDWLARQELWCDAQEQYQLSLNLRDNPEVQPTAAYVAEECANPQPSSSGGGEATLTPTLTAPSGGEATPTSPPPGATPTATNPPPAATPTATNPPPTETPTPTSGP